MAIDDGLRNFRGNEILIQIVDKPKTEITHAVGSERIKALHSIQEVLKSLKPITISEIREERLKENYGL